MHVCRRIVEITARDPLPLANCEFRLTLVYIYIPSPNSRKDSAFINHANRPPFARVKRKKGDEVSPGKLSANSRYPCRAKILLSHRRKAIFNLHIARGEGLIYMGKKKLAPRYSHGTSSFPFVVV